MAKNYYVSQYFHAPPCPLGCGQRMTVSLGDAKFICQTHGVKVEFTSGRKGMKTYLDMSGGEPPHWWPWNNLRKR